MAGAAGYVRGAGAWALARANPMRIVSTAVSLVPVLALLAVLATQACTERVVRPPSPPVVAGLAHAGLEARVRGLVLLGELGCVACHGEDAARAQVDRREGPDLAGVGRRVRADYLAGFLADPLRVAPGTTMPDVLHDLGDGARGAAAEALAQYLRSFGEGASASEAPDAAAAARGREVFHAVGCVACHAPRDEAGEEVALAAAVPLAHVAAKYRASELRTFLLAPHEARPSGRMPDLGLSPAEAHDLSSYLLVRAVADGTAPAALDAAKVEEGRGLFAARGCVQCHVLPDPARAATNSATPLRKLDPARGCLSTTAGAWPRYALSDAQRVDIRAALAAYGEDLSDEARIRQRLAARNCIACHERGEWGGVAPERAAFFITTDESIGHDGRLPPPLTGVGAKLQAEWLVDAIAHGQRERPYLRARMPGFGAKAADDLAALLARTDHLPPVEFAPLPDERKQVEAIRDLGRELVGDKGMNCITCHTFAGDRVGSMGAIDLVASTGQRLRREWFDHFLRAPARFRPGTLMPQFFVDGVSVRPEFADGDATKQREALWHYLAEGRNVRKPSGLRRPPIELTVGDDAVILRRSVQNTGKRGISVGYPGGVNLTFDAESLGLNQIWWGGFLDASPVWMAQGSGEARILGKERVALPKGPAFAALKDATAAWPDASRRELGQRFLGYDLDDRQRPTFRYEAEGVTITDAPIEVAGDGARPSLRRTLTLVGAKDATLYFRAAQHARLDDLGDGAFQVGPSLRLRVSPGAGVIRPIGEELELVIPIAVRGGRAEQVLEYRWTEKK